MKQIFHSLYPIFSIRKNANFFPPWRSRSREWKRPKRIRCGLPYSTDILAAQKNWKLHAREKFKICRGEILHDDVFFCVRLNCFSGQVRVKKCSRVLLPQISVNGMFSVVMFQINSDLCGIFNFQLDYDRMRMKICRLV